MRTLVIALSVLATVSMAAAAEASRDRAKSRYDAKLSSDAYDDRRGTRERHNRTRRPNGDSEADIIRAESCDPAGRFAGYPAWARAAFSCGSQW
ncbi:MAG: hypothetical protein ABL908_04855 [Hyphomicrobium sp.]